MSELKFFLVKVQFNTEEGKKVKREYLVQAVSVTEAEARVLKALADSMDDFEVKSASESKICEVFK